MPVCAYANSELVVQELTVHRRQLGYALLCIPFSLLFSVPHPCVSIPVTVK